MSLIDKHEKLKQLHDLINKMVIMYNNKIDLDGICSNCRTYFRLEDTITIVNSYIFSTPDILPRRAMDYINDHCDSDAFITEYYRTNRPLCRAPCKIRKRMIEVNKQYEEEMFCPNRYTLQIVLKTPKLYTPDLEARIPWNKTNFDMAAFPIDSPEHFALATRIAKVRAKEINMKFGTGTLGFVSITLEKEKTIINIHNYTLDIGYDYSYNKPVHCKSSGPHLSERYNVGMIQKLALDIGFIGPPTPLSGRFQSLQCGCMNNIKLW